MSFEVRQFADADLPEVLELLRSSLGETALLARPPERFAWKHLDNPFGRSIVLVAEADGRIVGLRAFMRWELATPLGATLRCVRAVDTATHPDYQRRGIFRTLTMAALDEATADGVDLVFNTPNARSGAGYLTMGWQEVGRIGVLAMPGRGLLRRRPDPAALPRGDDYLTRPEPARSLGRDDRPPRGLRTPRTAAYLAWRFGGHPTARYFRVDSGGSTAVVRPNLRSGRRELVVSDVFGESPGRAIGAAFARSRSAYLAGWFSAGSPERAAARWRGMVPVPRLTALTWVARPLHTLPVRVDTLDVWDLASSDLELL